MIGMSGGVVMSSVCVFFVVHIMPLVHVYGICCHRVVSGTHYAIGFKCFLVAGVEEVLLCPCLQHLC